LEVHKIFLKIHWPKLPEESKTMAPLSHIISKKIITLPIYPDLQENQMKELVKYILKFGEPYHPENLKN
jgi:dTDP-4-amino-4,6-dideoxygalactose transaminase